jgi:hypothetical protein
MGNAWEPGRPVMSTLALRSLLKFIDSAELNLCQQIVWHNPAKLPSPAQWVNVERIRVKDSYTHVWWLAKTSLLNAIRWALYGKTMDRLSREIPLYDLVNSEARDAGDFLISVKLRFEVGNAEYELFRSAEPDDLVARPRANYQFRQESEVLENLHLLGNHRRFWSMRG